MVSDSVNIRVIRPIKKGNRKRLTILKSHVGDDEEHRTIKVTLDGEEADLQVKWIKSFDSVEVVHLHCLKHKESSEWGKASGIALERFYKVTQTETKNVLEIMCRGCGRRWITSGSV